MATSDPENKEQTEQDAKVETVEELREKFKLQNLARSPQEMLKFFGIDNKQDNQVYYNYRIEDLVNIIQSTQYVSELLQNNHADVIKMICEFTATLDFTFDASTTSIKSVDRRLRTIQSSDGMINYLVFENDKYAGFNQDLTFSLNDVMNVKCGLDSNKHIHRYVLRMNEAVNRKTSQASETGKNVVIYTNVCLIHEETQKPLVSFQYNCQSRAYIKFCGFKEYHTISDEEKAKVKELFENVVAHPNEYKYYTPRWSGSSGSRHTPINRLLSAAGYVWVDEAYGLTWAYGDEPCYWQLQNKNKVENVENIKNNILPNFDKWIDENEFVQFVKLAGTSPIPTPELPQMNWKNFESKNGFDSQDLSSYFVVEFDFKKYKMSIRTSAFANGDANDDNDDGSMGKAKVVSREMPMLKWIAQEVKRSTKNKFRITCGTAIRLDTACSFAVGLVRL